MLLEDVIQIKFMGILAVIGIIVVIRIDVSSLELKSRKLRLLPYFATQITSCLVEWRNFKPSVSPLNFGLF